jgi:hypothetical protein
VILLPQLPECCDAKALAPFQFWPKSSICVRPSVLYNFWCPWVILSFWSDPHSTIGTLMDSTFGFIHLNDPESRFQQNCLPLQPTGNLHKCKNLRCNFYFHFTLVSTNLPVALALTYFTSCPKYPFTSHLHWCSRTYARFTNLWIYNSIFQKWVKVTWKDIKLHKFIYCCGLIHVHSPREKQYSYR